jgi:hypothetical protein
MNVSRFGQTAEGVSSSPDHNKDTTEIASLQREPAVGTHISIDMSRNSNI